MEKTNLKSNEMGEELDLVGFGGVINRGTR